MFFFEIKKPFIILKQDFFINYLFYSIDSKFLVWHSIDKTIRISKNNDKKKNYHFLLVDNVLKFAYNVRKTNIKALDEVYKKKFWKTFFQFFIGRFGIGKGLANFFSQSIGWSSSFLKIDNYNDFFYVFFIVINHIRIFLLNNKYNMDLQLFDTKSYSLYRHRNKFTYKGWCIVNKYPINGQRRRSNFRTSKKRVFFYPVSFLR